jgi:hypothetical protein
VKSKLLLFKPPSLWCCLCSLSKYCTESFIKSATVPLATSPLQKNARIFLERTTIQVFIRSPALSKLSWTKYHCKDVGAGVPSPRGADFLFGKISNMWHKETLESG